MKKVLFATTAFGLVGASVTPALATEKIRLELGGMMNQYFGGAKAIKKSDNDKARDGLGVDTRVRIYVQGSTTLDNGLQVGAQICLQGEAHTAYSKQNAKWQYLYVNGDFGRLLAGERDGIFDLFAVRAPNVGAVRTPDTFDWLRSAMTNGDKNHIMGVPSLETTLDDGSLRVSYMTPSYYGFSAGLSFAPNAELGNARGVRVREGRRGSNEYQAGIAYSRTIEGWKINGDASLGSTIDGVNEWAYRSGLSIGYGSWTVGGSWMGLRGNGGARNTYKFLSGNQLTFDSNVWEAGVSWVRGPYQASFSYGQNNSKWGGAAVYTLGLAYTLGPGITAATSAFYSESNLDSDTFEYQQGQDGPWRTGHKSYRNGMGMVTAMKLEF